MAENNKGFAVYHEYWDAIKHFDKETQDKIAGATWRYCFLGETPAPDTDPMAFAMLMAWKMSLDNSMERFGSGVKGGRPAKVETNELSDLIAQGKKAAEIAEIMGVSVDTIYKRDEWKNRKQKTDKPQLEIPSNFGKNDWKF